MGKMSLIHDLCQDIRSSADNVRDLVDSGASLGATSSLGENALHFAARAGADEALVELLINGSSSTSPSSPADFQFDDIASLMFINSRDFFGRTPLHMAAMFTPTTAKTALARERCVSRLLEAGADPRARTKAGHTPLYLAKAASFYEDETAMRMCKWTVQASSARQLVKELVKRPVDAGRPPPTQQQPQEDSSAVIASSFENVIGNLESALKRALEAHNGEQFHHLTAPSWPGSRHHHSAGIQHSKASSSSSLSHHHHGLVSLVGSGMLSSNGDNDAQQKGAAPAAAPTTAVTAPALAHAHSGNGVLQDEDLPPYVLQICSDLHLEFLSDEVSDADLERYVEPVAPNLALLGDIACAFKAGFDRFLRLMCGKFEQVILIAGNHESYHCEYHESIAWLRSRSEELQLPNLRFMENDHLVVAGGKLRLLGCTLWSHVTDEAMDEVGMRLNDYHVVSWQEEGKTDRRPMIPADTNRLHQRSLEFLLREADEAAAANQRCVLLLHHAPLDSLGTSDPAYFNTPTTQAFSTDLLAKLLSHPAITHAFYGHTHWYSDISLPAPFSVRVISNPAGYRQEKYIPYDSSFAIDLTSH